MRLSNRIVFLSISIFLLLLLSSCTSINGNPEKTISHRVILDINVNQEADNTDIPLANVTLVLYDELGTKLEESSTNAEGLAFFSSIPGNSYFTYVIPQTDAEQKELACILNENTSICEYVLLADLSHVTNVTGLDSLALSNSTYLIRNVNSGQCLDVLGGSTADGGNIVQWPCHGNANQQWRLNDIGGGVYTLTAVHSDKVIDVAGGSTADGANIHQWGYIGDNNQKWNLTDLGDSRYELRALHSNKCADVSAYSLQNGANIHQWPCHGGTNQQFEFILSTQPLIQNGTYTIKARHSNLCLDAFNLVQQMVPMSFSGIALGLLISNGILITLVIMYTLSGRYITKKL